MSVSEGVDPDFSRDVLEDLYGYRRKRAGVAWLLWGTLGLLGAHRFYLEREFTGLLMLFTGGGGVLWWLVDALLLSGMVRSHNAEQALREEKGLPPIELDFMPPLKTSVLRRTPTWVERWAERGRKRRLFRLAGDVAVILVAGSVLGSLVGLDGALEAIVAVLLLAGVTALGAGPAWIEAVPLARHFVRWSHRLRLFYYHNEPGSPPALLVRPLVGVLWAPFRPKARAEVRMYVELGAAFTAAFFLLDLIPEAIVPLLSSRALDLGDLLGGWLAEAFTTFFLTYAFAAPIGAVLTLHLLVRPTHTLPRALSALTLVAIVLGALG